LMARAAALSARTVAMKKYKKHIQGKTILITGGTGSFGSTAGRALLSLNPKRVIVFSRDEKKQFDMGNAFRDDRLHFRIGDVRDRHAVDLAMKGVDYVFHAAALKQVPTGEFFPIELVKTNVIGSHNVIHSAIENGVKRVVVLSTDKACTPINVMGMTKALMERVMIAAARHNYSNTVVCGTRYGNVMYTRGSVIPYFIEQMRAEKPLTVTHGDMTRFMMTLDESIDLVLFALTQGKPGEMYVKKAPAATMRDLAKALVSLFKYKGKIKEIGIRPGEKIHESLISREENIRAVDRGNYFCILPESMAIDYRQYYYKGMKKHKLPEEGYTSANTKRLSQKEIQKLLMKLPEVREELKKGL